MMMFFYARVSNGVAQSAVMPSMQAQQLIGNVAPVDSMSNDQLATYGLARMTAPAYPRDGYRYMPGVPQLVNGRWEFAWERQDTPGRDATLASLSRQRREARDALLAQTDWTQLADAQLSAEKRATWAAYRQALRDVPTQADFPWEVTWPVKPA